MKTAHHDTIRTICYVIAAAAIGWAAYEYHESTSVLKSIRPDIEAAAYNVRTVTWNLAATADNIAALTGSLRDPQNGVPPLMAFLNGKQGVKEVVRNLDALTAQTARTSTTLEIGSRLEQAKITEASNKALEILGQLGELLKNTDASLNSGSGVLPAVTADLRALDGTIGQSTQDIHSLLVAGTDDMKAAGEVIADPDIKAALRSIAGTTAHADSAVGHLDQATAYIEADLAPQHLPLWKTIGLMALSQALGIPLKFLPSRVAVVSSVPPTSSPSIK